MSKRPSFSSRIKSFFSQDANAQDVPSIPSVPDVPLYVFSDSIEDNLKSLTDRINDLENLLDSCRSLSLGKYIDRDTAHRLSLCADRLECALEESAAIRGGILPPDGRPLLSPLFTNKELSALSLIVSQLHQKHSAVKTVSLALKLKHCIESSDSSIVADTSDLEKGLAALKEEEREIRNLFVKVAVSHYGLPSECSKNSPCKITGNIVVDYASLDDIRRIFASRARDVNQKIQDADSECLNDTRKTVRDICASYVSTSLQTDILSAISPDGSCPSPAPDLPPESVRIVQSLVDDIYSNICVIYGAQIHISSALDNAETQKRKAEVQAKIDVATAAIHQSSDKLAAIYNS